MNKSQRDSTNRDDSPYKSGEQNFQCDFMCGRKHIIKMQMFNATKSFNQ